MSALIIADAHIPAHAANIDPILRDVLRRKSPGLQYLVLLGDIFDFVTGDPKTHGPAVTDFLDQLERLGQQGCRVIWVEGNHDFQLAPQLTERYRIEVIPDHDDLMIGSFLVHVTHGDLIPGNDSGYRLLRAFLRSPLLSAAIRILPSALTRSISQSANRRSDKRHLNGATTLSDRVKQALTHYAQTQWRRGADLVLCGHFHHNWQTNQGAQQLQVVGAWADQPQAFFLDGATWKHEIYSPDASRST